MITRKLYSVISILGLGAGFAVASLIMLFIRYETSFDTIHDGYDRIYRLNWESKITGAQFATFFNPLSPRIAEAMPDKIEAVTRMAPNQEPLTINGQSQYEIVTFVDGNFFDFFSYDAISGNAKKAIKTARNAVITQAAATKLFGSETAVGKTFTLDGTQDFTVAAVIQNNPNNSHITSNIFINMELLPTIWGRPNMWEQNGSDQLYHYVKLASGVDAETVEAAAVDYVINNVFSDAAEWLRIPLQPITDIHFNTELQNEMPVRDTITGIVKTQRQKNDIYIFLIVGVLTLSIAAFNFMNLQVVQVSNRLREIGVRKILGATNHNLSNLFITESAALAVIALLIGVLITEMALPIFNQLVGSSIDSSMLYSQGNLGLLIGITFVIATLAGAYPAFLASKLHPAQAIHGEVAKNVGPAKIRTILMLVQFSIATGLIIASGVIGNQINYAFSKPLGFDAAGVVSIITSRSVSINSYPTIKSQLEQHPSIQSVSYANIIPSQDLFNGWSFGTNPNDPEQVLSTRVVNMGYGAFEILGMEMAAGRSFNENFPADILPSLSTEKNEGTAGVILNETAAKAAGWTDAQDAIGKQLVSTYSNDGVNYRYDFTVVGVLKDTHYQSIRSPIAPMSYILQDTNRQMIIKLAAGQEAEALAFIDETWKKNVPGLPIRRSILADDYAAFYAGENRTFSLIISFATIAVLISCVGLYGLTAYMVERRIKEVGIRKVLGATIIQIVTLLSWDYAKLVIIASVMVWPIAWYLMSDWLSSFAYQANLELSLFLTASALTLLMAAFTTSMRTYAAARMNPIHALRQE